MGEIRKVAKDVELFLAVDKKARNSDDYLYSLICQKKLMDQNIDANKIAFADVMKNRKTLGLPPYETVRRTRQKIQQHHPELRANADVQAMREVKEEEFKNYARSINV